tara:strand:+ start:1628 stop:2197 length:570 start_codon:yes stop_codon:yes gene_type:complete
MANPLYGQNKADDALDLLENMQQRGSCVKVSHAESSWTALALAHGTETAISAITQPAGTIIKHLILVADSAITSSGASGDGLDIKIGTSAGGTQLLAATELLDDGGSAVTLSAYTPLYIFENSHGHGANAFAAGVGPYGGPATTEAITPAASLFSAAEREIHVTFDPIDADLGATGNVKIICVFQHLTS